VIKASISVHSIFSRSGLKHWVLTLPVAATPPVASHSLAARHITSGSLPISGSSIVVFMTSHCMVSAVVASLRGHQVISSSQTKRFICYHSLDLPMVQTSTTGNNQTTDRGISIQMQSKIFRPLRGIFVLAIPRDPLSFPEQSQECERGEWRSSPRRARVKLSSLCYY
jgi:hypothetical protein